MQNNTYFISDLHLTHHSLETSHFLKWLAHFPSEVKALYILGDLFDMWIGDDDLDTFTMSIIHAIRTLKERGVCVYFQHGNRDFLIAQRFAELSHCILLPDEYVLTINTVRILLMHGDTLCKNDLAYQRARKYLRNAFVQWVFLKLPLSIRRRFALHMRRKSTQYTRAQIPAAMDVTQAAVDQVMQQHQAALLIHGHTHLAGQHSFILSGRQVQRIVLPAWHDHVYVLSINQDGAWSNLPIF